MTEWCFPRGDLYHWLAVINRFDAILDRIVHAYDLLQPKPASPTSANAAEALLLLGHASKKKTEDNTTISTNGSNSNPTPTLSGNTATAGLADPNQKDGKAGSAAKKEIEHFQKEPFEANDRNLVLAVLKTTRVILENCSNRVLYTSYEVCIK